MSHPCFLQTPIRGAIQQPNPVITKHIFNNKQYYLPPSRGEENSHIKRTELLVLKKSGFDTSYGVQPGEVHNKPKKKYDRRQCAVLELAPLKGEKKIPSTPAK